PKTSIDLRSGYRRPRKLKPDFKKAIQNGHEDIVRVVIENLNATPERIGAYIEQRTRSLK
ncbi:hypothetical protein KY362_02485, partial [Candidatus Woesearchaeota archaeon]|nr:hypothetical protein [Candidatus Woesearchaeota archaeon]